MARAFLTPTSTISNDNWTSSPDVGADLHLNVDGATYSPLDADEGTGLISGTASSSCSFGFPALPALATDHQWTNIRVAYFTQFLTVENYKFALRVKVGANIIGQTSDHITNGLILRLLASILAASISVRVTVLSFICL